MIVDAKKEPRQQLSLGQLENQVAEIHTDVSQYQAALQSACFNSITPDDMKNIVQKQKAKALEGDLSAAKFMMHLVGMSRPVKISQTNIITDVEGAARLAKKGVKFKE